MRPFANELSFENSIEIKHFRLGGSIRPSVGKYSELTAAIDLQMFSEAKTFNKPFLA